MELQDFLLDLDENDEFGAIARDEFLQFGIPGEPELLGATILPERLTTRRQGNLYRETRIRYLTNIALPSTRYAPAQKTGGGVAVGSFLVELSESDAASEFTAEDYDTFLDHLEEDADQEAASLLLGWGRRSLIYGLVQLNEKQRWDAIVDSKVIRRGDGGILEPVEYADPAGHRVSTTLDYSDAADDPMEDILGAKEFLADKGVTIVRIIMSTQLQSILVRNPNVREAILPNIITLTNGNAQTQTRGATTNAALDEYLRSHRLPAVETYDAKYRKADGTYHRYLRDDCIVIIGSTPLTETVRATADPEYFRVLENTLGYVAIGRAAGQRTSGRVVHVEGFTNKPPRVTGEAWQTSLPVIMEPESIYVIKDIPLP